jgi:PIN domain nuclease of toxin-antitoxin system
LIVLDTHAWVWWVGAPELLSDTARKRIDEAVRSRSVYVSSISAWEVALLAARGRLQLTMNVEDWITKCEELSFINYVPVDNRIAVKSVRLPGVIHNDPADRIIIATTLTLGAVLVTRDEKILEYPHVKAYW